MQAWEGLLELPHLPGLGWTQLSAAQEVKFCIGAQASWHIDQI